MKKRNLIIILSIVTVVIVILLLLPSDETGEEAGEVNEGIETESEFYGSVTDQDGSPVDGASIEYSNINSTIVNESIQETQSDSAGLFSLNGNKAGIRVEVAKDGYIMTEQSKGAFRFAKDGSAVLGTEDNPAIFVLWQEE